MSGAVATGAPAQEPSEVAVQIDGLRSISFGEVDHWARIVSPADRTGDHVGQAVQFLVDNRWVEGEAAQRGIAVSDAEVRADFERTRAESFRDDAEYQAFLRSSGQTEDDVLLRVRADLLAERLRRSVEPRGAIAEAAVRAYFRKHRRRFAEPARRDVRLVLTRRRATAEVALRWLRQGQTWSSVARRLSRDPATRRRGGLLRDIVQGAFGAALDRPLFAAPVGALRGPVRTRRGWYVFSVRRARAARQLSFRAARPTVRAMLTSERNDEAMARFTRSFHRRWLARTHCLPGRVQEACRDLLVRRTP